VRGGDGVILDLLLFVLLMTTIDRAMIGISSARVIADILVLTAEPEWRSVVAQCAPALSLAQMIWVIAALRRHNQQGPYSSRDTDR